MMSGYDPFLSFYSHIKQTLCCGIELIDDSMLIMHIVLCQLGELIK